MPSYPSVCTFSTSDNPNHQSLAFYSSSSFLSPDTANLLGNPGDAAATLAQQHAKLEAVSNATHNIFAPPLAAG